MRTGELTEVSVASAKRVHLRVAWLCGAVLFLEVYDVASVARNDMFHIPPTITTAGGRTNLVTKEATSRRTLDDFGVTGFWMLKKAADDRGSALEAEQPAIHQTTQLLVGAVCSSADPMMFDVIPN
jgi:hypothetical protein